MVIMKNHMKPSQKVKNKDIMKSSYIITGFMSKRKEINMLKMLRHLHFHLLCSTITRDEK